MCPTGIGAGDPLLYSGIQCERHRRREGFTRWSLGCTAPNRERQTEARPSTKVYRKMTLVLRNLKVTCDLFSPSSSSNVKKWETELQSLRESNARLTSALQESAASIEHWKKQFSICKEENDQLRSKIEELEEQCNEVNQERERNVQLSRRLQELETELQDKELELEDLRKQGEIIPQLMTECETVSQKLQAAEKRNKDLEEKVRALRIEVEESKHRQNNLKTELQTFLDVLDGKIDELHDFRQGLSKLGVDN
ncbi:hypothetical protein EYD10_11996 [Varanus komodoensis]|nr:hypothetical protein EYD10_11996 [Varanus komodoensis]